MLAAPCIFLNRNEIIDVALTVMNSVGLFVVICLLGYGLVQVPQSLWCKNNYALSVKKTEFRAGILDDEMFETKEKLASLQKVLI